MYRWYCNHKRSFYMLLSFCMVFSGLFVFQIALEVNMEKELRRTYHLKNMKSITQVDTMENAFSFLFPVEATGVNWRNAHAGEDGYINKLNSATRTAQEFRDSIRERIDYQIRFSSSKHLNSNTKQKHIETVKKVEKMILILFYYDEKELNNESYKKEKCNVNNCRFSKRPQDFNRADVVVFKRIPPDLKRPLTNPYQLLLFLSLESPYHTSLFPHDERVNYTATYRLDSIIPTPYSIFEYFDQPRLKRNKQISQNINRHRYVDFASKTKLVAWFVSNCYDENGRKHYVKKLQKYIKVDIYGKCGKLKCEKSKGDSCYRMLQKDYKFYLAFENSNCIEYITEKFFNALRFGVIPVVMGARLEDYQRIAPPNSFIHIDQFTGPKQLAEYLIKISQNKNLYMKYFEWRSIGDIGFNLKYHCRLCSIVQLSKAYHFWYEDISLWWSNGTCLGPASKKTWNSWNFDKVVDSYMLPQWDD